MTYDASDRKSIRRAEKQARISDRARQEVISDIMSTTQGRQWMWDLLTSCHVFSQTFTADPLMTAFGEGRRAIGLAILADVMSACPDQYLTAAREANVRHYSNDRSTTNGERGLSEEPGWESAGPVAPDSDFEPGTDAADDFKGIYDS